MVHTHLAAVTAFAGLLHGVACTGSVGSPPPPPTPTGNGGTCPYFSVSPLASYSPSAKAECAQPSSLKKWQDYKFGLFLHWGAYSQIGIDASWSLNWATACTFGNPGLCAPKNCSECTHQDMLNYRAMYWGLSKTFNPTKFNPALWAEAASNAGMQYFVMTTKHHDGFAMYNTSQRGAPNQPVYGATGEDCPAQRDFFGEVTAAMRTKGLAVGAYYSKADWHSHSFWDPEIGFASDRNVNYNISNNATKCKWNFVLFLLFLYTLRDTHSCIFVYMHVYITFFAFT